MEPGESHIKHKPMIQGGSQIRQQPLAPTNITDQTTIYDSIDIGLLAPRVTSALTFIPVKAFVHITATGYCLLNQRLVPKSHLHVSISSYGIDSQLRITCFPIKCSQYRATVLFLINPFMPNETSHRYQLDESVLNLRVVG